MQTGYGADRGGVLGVLAALVALAGAVLLGLGLRGLAAEPDLALGAPAEQVTVETDADGFSLWSADPAAYASTVCTAGGTTLLRPVEPYGVVSGRTTADGEALDAILITRHLQFSLPYRAVFSQLSQEETARRLLDALAVLLVRLHLEGFFWGDVSLSNTLFRRDADAYAAYVVDAETGELHDQLSDGQRNMDLRIARMNIAGDSSTCRPRDSSPLTPIRWPPVNDSASPTTRCGQS